MVAVTDLPNSSAGHKSFVASHTPCLLLSVPLLVTLPACIGPCDACSTVLAVLLNIYVHCKRLWAVDIIIRFVLTLGLALSHVAAVAQALLARACARWCA